MAEEVFKNVQILKGIPVDEFMGTMGFFSASLGLNCTDCHVDESGGNWAQVRRRQPEEADGAPDDADGGGAQPDELRRPAGRHVQHLPSRQQPAQRAAEPRAALRHAAARRTGRADHAGAGTAARRTRARQVSPGVGGAAASSPRSPASPRRARTAGSTTRTRAPLEIFAKAPGQRTTVVHTLSGDSTTTYDGRDGWIAAPETEKPVPLLAITGQELDGVKLEAELWFPSRIKQALTKWRVGAPAVIDDREVHGRSGHDARTARRPRCVSTPNPGLLVRLVRFSESPVGRIVTQVDYADYRDVSGVKMPFRWTVSVAGRAVDVRAERGAGERARRRGEIREAGAEKVE